MVYTCKVNERNFFQNVYDRKQIQNTIMIMNMTRKFKCYQNDHDFFFLNDILSRIFEISPLIFSKVPVESGKFSNGI